MPFIAKLRSTGERVDITTYAQPRRELDASDVVCQLCDEPMLIRHGMIVRPHFAHKIGSQCAAEWGAHPESPEHRLGKLTIAEQLRQEYADYTAARIEYEVPIREVMRIADVMAIFPNGWRVAHECQLAAITTQKLEERTSDYFRAGVDVVWWLGGNAATPTNINWCLDHQGFVLRLEFNYTERDVESLPTVGHGL